jgi:hypothetical protein
MNFDTFKKEKMGEVMDQFLAPEILDGYKAEYGIEIRESQNDVESYEEVYKALGYGFLIFGRAIAKAISDVRVYETLPPPMKRFSVRDKDALENGAWYWVCNFKLDGVQAMSPTPMKYSADTSAFYSLAVETKSSVLDKESKSVDDVVILGPIPVPDWTGFAEHS